MQESIASPPLAMDGSIASLLSNLWLFFFVHPCAVVVLSLQVRGNDFSSFQSQLARNSVRKLVEAKSTMAFVGYKKAWSFLPEARIRRWQLFALLQGITTTYSGVKAAGAAGFLLAASDDSSALTLQSRAGQGQSLTLMFRMRPVSFYAGLATRLVAQTVPQISCKTSCKNCEGCGECTPKREP